MSNTGENAELIEHLNAMAASERLYGFDGTEKLLLEAATALAAAEGRIAALESLRTDLLKSAADSAVARLEAVQRAETAETLLGEARRALEPFAKHCDAELNDWCPDDVAAFYFSQDGFDEPSSVTVGDFRRARATLDRIGK